VVCKQSPYKVLPKVGAGGSGWRLHYQGFERNQTTCSLDKKLCEWRIKVPQPCMCLCIALKILCMVAYLGLGLEEACPPLCLVVVGLVGCMRCYDSYAACPPLCLVVVGLIGRMHSCDVDAACPPLCLVVVGLIGRMHSCDVDVACPPLCLVVVGLIGRMHSCDTDPASCLISLVRPVHLQVRRTCKCQPVNTRHVSVIRPAAYKCCLCEQLRVHALSHGACIRFRS
jgi:hypothetical protein